jgi:hypothetical protein
MAVPAVVEGINENEKSAPAKKAPKDILQHFHVCEK